MSGDVRGRCGLVASVVAVIALWSAATAQAADNATISGTVTNGSGDPVTSCGVELRGADGTPLLARGLDSGGGYTFSGLAAGGYLVRYYNCHPYANEWWDDKSSLATATTITLADSEQRTGIDATLAVGGTISGRVTDAGGAGVESICVDAFAVDPNLNFERQVSTNASGDYTVDGLPTGDYKVSFNECDPSPSFFGEYFDDVRFASQATLIHVETESSLTGKNASLDRAGSIAGRVTDDLGNPLAGFCVSASGTLGGNTTTDSNGDYTVAPLHADTYKLVFGPCVSDPYVIPEVYDNHPGIFLNDADPVVLGDGQALTGKDASLVVGGAVSGQITNGNGDPVKACVTVTPASGTGVTVTSDASGHYLAPRLGAGTATVSAFTCNGTVDRIFTTGTTAAVNRASTTTADLVVEEMATIRGRVTDTSGAPISGLCVSARRSGDPVSTTNTDSSGNYALTGLHAGPHKVSFADCDYFNGEPNAQPPYTVEYWNDKPTLAAADVVTVGEGDAAANIDAALTPDAIPMTFISSGPSGTTSSKDAVFVFGSDDPAATFDCSLDGALYSSCTSPTTYPALAGGQHSFAVRAHDVTGHTDLTPATQSWNVASGTGSMTVGGTVPAGGTVSTDPLGAGPSRQNPVTTAVTTPDGGSITISSRDASDAHGPSTFALLGQVIQISAPSASVDRPLRLEFAISGSEIPSGTDPDDITPLRDGEPAGECPGSDRAHPDPCVSERHSIAGGGVSLTVLTSHASLWAFGRAVCAVPKLKGKTIAQAKKKLKQANCKLGKVRHKSANSAKQRGKVISQSKKPKTQLDPGTKIGVVVGG